MKFQYPTWELPDMLKHVVQETANRIQVPHEMVANSCLTTIASVCQNLVDVQLPAGGVRPTSLYVLTVAASGDRKSTTDRIVAGPLNRWEQRNAADFLEATNRFEIEHASWATIHKALRQKLTRRIQRGDGAESATLELEASAMMEPTPPQQDRILLECTTARPLIRALKGYDQAVTILSAEGGTVLGTGLVGQAGLLNQLWDGPDSVDFDRVDEKIQVFRPRVTVGLMIQPGVLDRHLERNGDVARESGHWARYLIAKPFSLKGNRIVMQDSNLQSPCLAVFHERVDELLRLRRNGANTVESKRAVLKFNVDAAETLIGFGNRMEAAIRPGEMYSTISDFASRAMEQAGRISALLHHFCQLEGSDISVSTVESACRIVDWHMSEATLLFGTAYGHHGLEANAQKLLLWLIEEARRKCVDWVGKTYARNNGPVRPVSNMEEALSLLTARNQAWIAPMGEGRHRKQVVVVHRELLGWF